MGVIGVREGAVSTGPERPSVAARDHVFVSYAGEDWALADWLTRKLTVEGYLVWCDRFKLLGGEPYPADIDDAIKRRTFRVLALMSRSSVNKPNPRKERTLAHNLARERNEPDFVIPLNVDGMKPTELDWMTTDLTFIPFNRSWAGGLAQLLKKLESIDAPRPLETGKRVAAETFLARDVVTLAPEPVYTNCLPVRLLPETTLRVRLSGPLPEDTRDAILQDWTYYATDPQTLYAFAEPVALPDGIRVESVEPMPAGASVPTLDAVAGLLGRALERKCLERGLARTLPWSRTFYFARGLLPEDKLQFAHYGGGRTWIRVAGDRTFHGTPFRYHIAPWFRVRRDVTDGFTVQVVVSLHLTNQTGRPLEGRARNARRKQIARSWWNGHRLKRQLAVCEFLADGSDTIVIGDRVEERVVISATPIRGEAPCGIDEEKLTLVLPDEGEEQVDG